MKSPEALDRPTEKNRKVGIIVENGKPVGYVTPKLLKFETGPVTDAAEPFQIFVEDDEPLRTARATRWRRPMGVQKENVPS